jgi:hypothetical protein
MSDHPLYSPATTALLLAMSALQRAGGVPPDVALENALRAWRERSDARGSDAWEYDEIVALVERLTS